jgi:nicotinamide-nucleotide amidase
MVRHELLPYLSRRFGTRLPGCTLTVRFVGLGQSQIDQTLKDHVVMPPGVMVSSQFDGGRVDFTFSLPDDTPAERQRLDALKRAILQHLGDSVYADGKTSLEQVVVRLLQARGASLALAEAASCGSLAAGLSGVEGADRVLAGCYAAPNEAALRRLLQVSDEQWRSGASSDQRTQLLAAAAAAATGSQAAVAVGGVQRDQQGAAYVDVAFQLPDGRRENQRVAWRGEGDVARSRLATRLFDQLRRQLR